MECVLARLGRGGEAVGGRGTSGRCEDIACCVAGGVEACFTDVD